jgi:DNA-directed RNA polymerase subunit RPC12/RpoP
VAFDEKAFFNERPEQRPAQYQCPRCKRTNEYSIRWMRRTKRKDRQPQGGEERAKFDKLRDHLLRLDDEVTCKTCGKKFEVPSHRSGAAAGGADRPGQAAGAFHASDQGLARLATRCPE